MTQFSYEIKDAAGIHARPAGLLVKLAGTFQSDITIECGGKKASAKKLFAVMGMGIKCGSAVTVTAKGADERQSSLKHSSRKICNTQFGRALWRYSREKAFTAG